MAESSEFIGYNSNKVDALVEAINSTFSSLTAESELLTTIETNVQNCWIGEDAEKYIDSVYAAFEKLVGAVEECYKKITHTVLQAGDDWKNFQATNSIEV